MFSAKTPIGIHSYAHIPPASATLIVAAIARELGAVGIGAGQISTPTDQQVIRVGKAVLDAGLTKYTETQGLLVVRGGIAFALNNELGTEFGPDNVGLRSGGKGVLSNVAAALLTTNPNPANPEYDGNNRMMAPSHTWVSHPHILANAGELHRLYGDNTNNGYEHTIDMIRGGIDRIDPKIFMRTAPGNPSGMTDTEEKAKALANLFKEYPGLFVATETMYRWIRFGGADYHHSLQHNPKAQNEILVDCTAKQGPMNQPGKRGGVLASNNLEFMKIANNIDGHKSGNSPIDAQWGALVAYLGEEVALKALEFQVADNPEGFIKFLEDEKGYVTDQWRQTCALNESLTPGIEAAIDLAVGEWKEAGLGVKKPGGAFYLYPDISSGTKDAVGLMVPEGTPLYRDTPLALLEDINKRFGTTYESMAGKPIRDSGDYTRALLLHGGVGATNGGAFFKPDGDDVVTTFRASAAMPEAEFAAPVRQVADFHKSLVPVPNGI